MGFKAGGDRVKLPTYPRTKPSGVEWLGDVPEHWTPIALRRTSTRYAGGTPDRSNDSFWEDGTIPWINSGAVNQGLITDPSAYITEDAYRNSSARWVTKGALVMALAGQGKTKGMVAQTGIATTCNQSMSAICPAPPMEARYLYWLLVSQYEHIRNMAGGEARDGLNLEILGAIPCLKVPPAEQQAIAAYLDRETGRLDRLVGRKRELIERLKEKRTALISDCVTGKAEVRMKKDEKGRSSYFCLPTSSLPKKPSGLDWLGDIPTHWEVVRLGRRIELQRGVDITKDEQSEGNVPVVSSGGISSFHDKAFAKGPGVVVGRKGTAGAVHWVECDYWPHDTTLYVREFGGNSPKYVFYKLCSMNLASFDTGSANPTLNRNLVHPVLVSWPPLPEQAAIAAYLDLETAKLDALVEKVEAAVERLQEYRTALITAAVTGKIDVRNQPS